MNTEWEDDYFMSKVRFPGFCFPLKVGYRKAILCTMFPRNWASPFMAKLIDDLFLGYDKRLRPDYLERPLEVSGSAYIISLSNVDEINKSLTVSIFFRQHWIDPRLKYDAPKQNLTHITLNPENLHKVWSPDTFIINDIKSFRNDILLPNEVIRISPIGEIMKSSRLTITALCPMDLHNFPFNELICNLEFESYDHKTDEVYYTWKLGNNSTLFGEGLGTNSYTLVSVNSLTHQINISSGNYSRLIIQMKLQRLCCRYIFSTYLPTIVLVFLSLLSLWIANMKISTIISFLNMGIMIIVLAVHNYAADTPKVPYLTALDIHILLCVTFIICIVLVNVTMFYFVKKAARLTTSKRMKNINISPADAEASENLNKKGTENQGKSYLDEKITGITLDVLSNLKFIFLISFAALEVAYWTYYLS